MPTTAQIMKKFARFNGLTSRGVVAILKGSILVCILFSPFLLHSQHPDSPQNPSLIAHISLPQATIRDVRFERTGYAFLKVDSFPISGPIPLSDRLLWEAPLDVRVNAPGTLATLSIRGSGPTRTPVFWNGINLQSPMNGVVDASLLPIWQDDKLEIHYGGQSAAQSSGAMSGSVELIQGTQSFGKGLNGTLQASTGSFGRQEAGGSMGYSNQGFATMIRVAGQAADNDFYYQKKGLDGQFYSKKQVNNGLKKADLQQFNQWKINDKNSLKTAFWVQNAFRELPPLSTESPRETWQRDRAHRFVLNWDHAADVRSLWTTRVAWLDDYLAFYLAGNTDTSRSRQVLLSTERSASLGKHWAWRLGGNALRQWAQVDGYVDSTTWFGQTRLAGFAMGEWHKGNTRFSGLLRQEWAEAQATPFTASLGGQIGLGRVGEGVFHISRNFNLPTLNDRFWKNLGRPDLRPEKGYSADLGWVLKKADFSLEITGFQLIMDDWILWQPDSTGLFRPDNVRKVWSRGMEGGGSRQWLLGPWILGLSGRLQLSKTTNVSVYTGSESALGKQLPYTPKASAGFTFRVTHGVVSAAYTQQFTGERLDNSGKAVNGFQIGNILASCELWKHRIAVNIRIENLWNSQYEVIRYRPMPGRSWQLGLGIKW